MATIYHQLWIDAPLARVYEAIANAEGLGRWWAPHTETRTGAGLVLSHDPGPDHGPVQFRVLRAVPALRVHWEVISSHPPHSPASAWTGTRICFELSERPSPGPRLGFPAGEKRYAVLDFQHSGWDEKSEFIGFCSTAWGEVLHLLKSCCEA